MLWSEGTELEVVNFSDFHIHSKIRDTSKKTICYLTGFYDALETSKQIQSWILLGKINPGMNTRWCVMGDFNGW